MILFNRQKTINKATGNSELSQILSNSSHIVVIKLRYVGDSVWLLPFLENLKLNLPNTLSTAIVNPGTEAVISNTDFVDNIIVLPRDEVKKGLNGVFRFLFFIKYIRKLRPDVIIDLTNSDRAAAIAFLSNARIRIGFTNSNLLRSNLFTHLVQPEDNGGESIYPFQYSCGSSRHLAGLNLDILRMMGLRLFVDTINLATNESAKHSLKRRFPEIFMQPYKKTVLIHPGARIPLRQWGVGNFAKLGDLLTEHYRVILVAGPEESHILTDICSKMSSQPYMCIHSLNLEEFVALCEFSDLFIGNDSGPIHIAATKTFTIGIYGPNTDEISGPWTQRKYIFENASLPCRPCQQAGCNHQIFKFCLESIRPKDVASKVFDILDV